MRSKKYAEVNKEQCAACGACTKECPRDAISVWRGCYAAVKEDICIGCGKCFKICPAGCITIKDRKERDA